LVPIHKKLDAEQVEALLKKHFLEDVSKLPKIKVKDPALSSLDVSIGDVVEITRKSFAGLSKYYRVVIE
jgi:DNA-directed RNA polymerase subunit H (RpoH/RPB5)